MYELHKTATLSFSPGVLKLTGGSSDATWRVAVDFSAEGAASIEKMWLTFAPRLANSQAYQDEEWAATFTNWSVSDPQGRRALKVAGPGSVRIEESDSWVRWGGFWEWAPAQFWSGGRAMRAAETGPTATVETHCGATHDINLGTRIDYDCGKLGLGWTAALRCGGGCSPTCRLVRIRSRSG